MTRVGVGARTFGLAAALGLAASASMVPDVAGTFLLLCAIAAVASVQQPTASARRVVPIIEGALVGLALASDGSVDQPLMLYLIVPSLIAGLVGGRVVVSITMLAELATMASVPVVRQQAELLPATFRLALPWLLTAAGMGLLGSWIRRLRSDPYLEGHAEYVVAHRLLDELRDVSRRLSSGLDAVLLSTTLINDALAKVADGRGAVLVRTDGGVFVALAQQACDDSSALAEDPVVGRCWTTGEAGQRQLAPRGQSISQAMPAGGSSTDDALASTRWAFPVLVGDRMVAVVALDVGYPLAEGTLADLHQLMYERALPLDAALLFDDVRTLATVEERRRLAREIHDGVAQEIASLGYLVDDLAYAPDAARTAAVDHLRAELTRIVDDLRLSIFDLRSQVSHTTGLGSVLAEYLREVGTRSSTAVHLTLDETPGRLRLDVEEQFLRIVQEAVTNARKHSGAENLWVTCRVRPPTANLIVEDDGSGLHGSGASSGFGLSIMRERADRIGATLELTDRPGGGTRVSVLLNDRPEAKVLLPSDPEEPPRGLLRTKQARQVVRQ